MEDGYASTNRIEAIKHRPLSLREAVELAMAQSRHDDEVQGLRLRHSSHIPILSPNESSLVGEETLLKRHTSKKRKLAINWLPARDNPVEGDFQLSEIDDFLGRTKPPAIELLVVEVIVTKNLFSLSHLGRWAHSAIRYTLPNGEQKLVNICRPGEGHELIEFYDDPRDYILGVDGKGGIFSRDIASIRIEEMNDSSMWAIHHYFMSTSHRFKADGKGVKFKLTGGFWHNVFRYVFGLRNRPSGNCARWVSQGLVYANVLKRATMFPKSIFLEIIEDQTALDDGNVNVVYYNRIKPKAKLKPHLKTGFSFCRVQSMLPFTPYFLQNILYWDLRRYANVIVDNPEEAQLDDQQNHLKCTLSKGRGYRLPPGVALVLRVLQKLTMLVGIFLYTFYCPDGYETNEDATYGTCDSSWPRAIGFRALISICIFSLSEFWFY